MGAKFRDLIRQVERDGWYLVRTKGSHQQFHHPVKPGTVTIAGHPNDDATSYMEHSILRQAGIERKKR